MLASLITPTYGRPDKHADLLRTVLRQTHRPLELLVWDDSPTPSRTLSVAARSKLGPTGVRVVYVHDPRRVTIGTKRNMLASMAEGEVLLAIDDDDAYAPGYVARMIERLQTSRADLVKLAVWRLRRALDGSLWEWDTSRSGDPCWCVSGAGEPKALPSYQPDEGLRHSWVWGYGFSYCYRPELARRVPFPDMSLGEDHAMVRSAQRAGMDCRLIHDGAAWVEHLVHERSTSQCFPQVRIR